MKNKLFAILIVGLIAGSISLTACTSNIDKTATSNDSSVVLNGEKNVGFEEFGAQGAKNDDTLTLEDMISYSIEDEYLARSEYEIIMDKFGEEKPFTNIIKAEVNHIEQLTVLFSKYNVLIPQDISMDFIVVPDNLNESFAAGVAAEIENIAMYEKFLKEDIPEDVRAVFIELRDGSESHLSAFEKNI